MDDIEENPLIRGVLDQELTRREKPSCHTVANTIFPQSLWNSKRNRQLLFERYEKAWPYVKKCPANKRGVYFRRLTCFKNGKGPVNQLEHIIETWHKGNHRHAALGAPLFDPRRDHTNSQQQGFPCLQHVSFSPLGTNGEDGLIVTGYYPTQYFFEKAYGNYLGLYRLGRFMAHEMGLELKQVNCIAISPRHGGFTKKLLKPLGERLEEILSEI